MVYGAGLGALAEVAGVLAGLGWAELAQHGMFLEMRTVTGSMCFGFVLIPERRTN